MKNLMTILSTLVVLVFFSLQTYAQVNVVNNRLGIGITSPTEKLHVNGYAKFEMGSTDLYFDLSGSGGGGGEPTIRPSRAYYGFLGTSSNFFWRTYTYGIYRNSEFFLSDRRVKKNIVEMDNALDKLMQLQGYTYELNPETHPFMSKEKSDKETQMGFVAQELQEVFPEMIVYDEELGYYVVKNVEQLLPVLVEAIKEQQAQIDELKAQIDK